MKRFIIVLLFLACILAITDDEFGSKAESRAAQQVKPELITQTGHIKSVEAIVISPDKRWVATGSADNTIKIWDIESGRELRAIADHKKFVRALVASSDGKLLVSGGSDGEVHVWNVVSGTDVGKFAVSAGTVEALAISPDGTRIASGGSDKTILVRELATGMEVAKLPGHSEPISALAFSPDGLTLASGGADKMVKTWDIAKSKPKNDMPGHTAKVRVVKFDPTGSVLASGGIDKTVRLWKTADGKPIKSDAEHGGEIQALHFAAAGKLVSGSSDRATKVWDTDGRGSAGPAGKRVGDIETDAKSAAFSSDGSLFATGESGPTANLFDAATGKQLASFASHTSGFYGVAFSSDRRWMAGASYDNSVKLWDLGTGESLAAKKGHAGRVTSVAFHPESPSRRIVSGSVDGTVIVWDTLSVEPLAILRGHSTAPDGRQNSISTVAIGSKGKLLVTGGLDTRIGIFNLDDSKAAPRFLTEHTGEVTSVAISTDERFIASASADATIKIWDIAAGKPIHIFTPAAGEISAVAFSPDGKLIASGGVDGMVRIWESESREPVSALPAHSRRVNAISFNPSGTQIVSSGQDKTVKIWDVATRREIRRLTGHSGGVKSAACTPDGRFLASASEDGSINAYTTETGDRIATLLSIKDGNDWLVAATDGFFDGSPASYDQLSWRFEKDTFTTKPVEIFFNEFYVPGLLADLFASRKLPPTNISAKERRQPELVLSKAENQPAEVDKVALRIDIKSAPAGAKDVRLFRNDTLVKVWRDDQMGGKKSAFIDVTIPIVAGQNRLTAYAFNTADVKSRNATLKVDGPPLLAKKGISYILAIGVDKYANNYFDLDLAVKDAEEFAEVLKGQQTKLGEVEKVEPIIIRDKQATKATILNELAKLATKVKPEDRLTIFYAGHGLAVKDRFYLLPHDIGHQPSRYIEEGEFAKLIPNWISDIEIGNAVEGIDAGQMLMILDACNSGKALDIEEKRRGPMNSKGLAQLAYEKGMYILTASQALETAKEDIQLGHGYLTHALVVQGLRDREADRNKDNQILLREWLDFATMRVPEIAINESVKKRGVGVGIGRSKTTPAEEALSLQRPRVFYRRESESRPILVATY